MSHTETGMRVAGAWLAAASVLLIVTFLGHGPIHPDLGQQMKDISDGMSRWVIVHWIAAVSLSLFAGASLVVLTTGSRLIERWWTLSAWALLPVGALWTLTTAVAEATAVANAAAANDVARFRAWWSFAEGNANGFMALCLAVAVIAANETRNDQPATPLWASWVGAVAGTGAFVAWPLGMWFGVALGGPFWVASSIAMSLWTLWFGLGLARAEFGIRTVHRAPSRG